MKRGTDISFCMIARDNAASIRRCLESVSGIADELIVIDTGSRDDTPEIARRCGATVLHAQWANDFSTARNQYLRTARCSWILSLDADEIASGWDRHEIQLLLRENANTAFIFSIRTYFSLEGQDENVLPSDFGGEFLPGIGWTLSRTIRLFPNHKDVCYCYPIHESVQPSLLKAGIPIHKCVLPIHHFGYFYAQNKRSPKANLYKALGLKKIAQYPDHFLGYWELGKLFLQERDYSNARKLFAVSCERNPSFASAWYYLCLCLLLQNEHAEAKACLQQARWRFSRCLDFLYLSGVLELRTQSHGAACLTFAEFLKRKPNYLPALLCLARAYEDSGKTHLAIDLLQMAIRVAPRRERTYLWLARLAELTQDRWLLVETLRTGFRKASNTASLRAYMNISKLIEEKGMNHACFSSN